MIFLVHFSQNVACSYLKMKNNKGKHKPKNTMRTAEEIVKSTLFSFKNNTSARHSPSALFAAFFGKLIKVNKSTRETIVIAINIKNK